MKSKCSIIILFLLSFSSFGQSKVILTKEEVLSDFKTLIESLEAAHYNLYAYTSKKEVDSVYFILKKSIKDDSISYFETTNIFQQFISTFKNGHTEIDFPASSYIEYAINEGTIFPLEIAFVYGKPLVRKNWSNDQSIKVGSEIISINGKPIKDIISRIYLQISAERNYLKNAKIEMYSFPRYFWQVYGKVDEFDVEILSNGSLKNHSIKAVNVIDGYESKRDEVLNSKMKLSFFNKSTYLNPGNFSGNEMKYQHFIDSAFIEINKGGYTNLIIDLRNNGGGDNSFSDYLVSYIANKPFKWNSSFRLKTSELLKQQVRKDYDTTDTFWQEVLNHKSGEIFSYDFGEYNPQPEEIRFKGDIFVLINRQSHSQSAVTAAQIQDYSFGTLVGEETGDYPSLFASQFQFKLPITGIPVKVSKGYILRVNGNADEHGVIPDIFIKDYLLDEPDEILNALLNKIDE